jgi:hypothetical protein
MKQPQSNGLVEIQVERATPERGFNCMKLIIFLTEDGVEDWDEWHGAHLQAAAGQCPYADRCPIHARNIKNRPIQLSLF